MRRIEGEEMAVAKSGTTMEHIDAEAVLGRYRTLLGKELRGTLADARAALFPAPATTDLLDDFYGQIEYHLGWRHPDLSHAKAHPGKLLRPTLVLLAAELAAGRQGLTAKERAQVAQRVAPAGVCVELVHNFSLVHDDIEDGDEHRRHRPTLWKLWGVPQAINTGDGIFAIARTALWRLVPAGIAPEVIVQLAAMVDRTCLELCEGQYLDMRFEGRRDVTVAMYLDMIGRKTASLMACSTEMGARLGAPDDTDTSDCLARFGRALGLAFQLRDDLLGIWAAQEELGKSAAGDLRKKKMSLPVIHAMENASPADLQVLTRMYAQEGDASDELIADALTILERTGAHGRVRDALREQGALAQSALDDASRDAPEAGEAHDLLAALLQFVTSGVE